MTTGLGNSLYRMWWHDDIVQLKASIGAALAQTQSAVGACASLDATTKANWTSFYNAAMVYVNDGANWLDTGSQADAGQEIQRQITSWQQTISGKGCSIAGPLYDGDFNKPSDPAGTLTTILKYGSIIAVAWGVSYVVSQIVEFVPKPVK